MLLQQIRDYAHTTETPEPESGVCELKRVRRPTILAGAHLARAYNLSDQRRVDDAIDFVVGTVNHFLSQGRFIETDELLHELDVGMLNSDVSVALLMATFPARDHLRERAGAIARLAGRLAVTEPQEFREILRILG